MKSFFLLLLVTFNIFSSENNQEEGVPTYTGTVSLYSGSQIVQIGEDTKNLCVYVRINVDQGIVNKIREYRRNDSKTLSTILSWDAKFKGKAICGLIRLDIFQNEDGSFKIYGDYIEFTDVSFEPAMAFKLVLDDSFANDALQKLYNKYMQSRLPKDKCVIL